MPHHINLESTKFRQTENELISCVNSLAKGTVSSITTNYMKSLERNINETENTIYLFSRNYKKNLYNHDELKSMPGNLKVYESENEGDSFYLRKFQAPRKLGLKIWAPVMLVVNISDSLVNGSMVTELNSDTVIVRFKTSNQTIKLSKYMFTKIDLVSWKTFSKRLHTPLILALGITIQKFQGMTLDSVVVDGEDASKPGQIGVALGRAVNSEN